jgi:methylated-DNA-[protein]-cysteine S-methyltransferase
MNSKLTEDCYKLLRTVPRGNVTTYKDLAIALGTKAYRLIGRIMNKNPDAPNTPCHRVVNSNGKIGGYFYGTSKKKELLAKEGISTIGDSIWEFDTVRFKFPSNKDS